MLPCDECKGKCCTFPSMSREEFRRIKAVHSIPKDATVKKFGRIIIIYKENGACPYLIEGKCSVYPLRPSICRKYGTIPELPCAYLYPEKANAAAVAMLDRMMRFSLSNPEDECHA